MDLRAAPLHADLAESPAHSRAYWASASDGVQLRLAHFPSEESKGTVLLFPGRTEYVEKYGRCAHAFARAGYHTLTIDWRGQGLAERVAADARVGHVNMFEDYQRDVEAMMAAARALDLPEPFHLLGHSMGGAIGLRALYNGLPVESCAFTGPMWGIRMGTALRPAAWLLSWGSKHFGLGEAYAPGTDGTSHVADGPFENNDLTTDPEMWDYMRAQVLAQPDLQLGGPSLTWVHEALSETLALSKRPAPAQRCVTYLGLDESIVDQARIRARMESWRNGHLVVLPGKHELLMEAEPVRNQVFDGLLTHFDGKTQPQAECA